MGLPTRLHGIAILDLPKEVKGFCPKCVSFRDWEVRPEGGTFYKHCVKCGFKKEIKEPELNKLIKEKKSAKTKKRH